MMNLSLYAKIGLIAFAAVAVIGITVKITLRAKRKKTDGIHGFVHKQKVDRNANDGWELL